MNLSLRALSCALFASIALASCAGGSGSTTPKPPAAPDQSSHDRAIRSTCTPDSYGYCLVETGHTRLTPCDDSPGTQQTSVYSLMLNGSFDGQYTLQNGCGVFSWSPDPAETTGDPNLP